MNNIKQIKAYLLGTVELHAILVHLLSHLLELLLQVAVLGLELLSGMSLLSLARLCTLLLQHPIALLKLQLRKTVLLSQDLVQLGEVVLVLGLEGLSLLNQLGILFLKGQEFLTVAQLPLTQS